MIINNTEALKSWLIIVLEPLCDADSSALARYVLALLKKDKPEKELKRVMIEQLDVFLGEETKPFVERLFDAIGTEEYLTTPAPLVTANLLAEASALTAPGVEETLVQPASNQETNTLDAKMSDITPSSSSYMEKIPTPPLDENKTKDSYNSNSNKFNDATTQQHLVKPDANLAATDIAPFGGTHVRSASPPAKANADKENQPRESRRRRASLRSRSRSRSRSNERLSRRSRSRDRRINEREKNQRQFRNKSPPSLDTRHASSHDRRRGGGGGGERRRMGGVNIGGGTGGDDRSPRFGGSGGESGRKGRLNRSNSRSRSPSLERSGRGGKASPNMARAARGSPDRHHHSSHTQHENEKRQRCRDFDEKGYCVRGETCPWDHGVNPVVFEGINNPTLISMSLREYNPDAPEIWSRPPNTGAMVGASPSSLVSGSAAAGIAGGVAPTSINPFTGAARPGSVMGGVGCAGFPHVGAGVADKAANGALAAAEYARQAVGGFRGAAPILPFPFNPAAVTTPLQRELIPIPVVDANAGIGGDVSAMQQGKRRFELEDSVAIAEGPAKRKVPLNSRLGPRLPSIQNNCSLELRKVPRGLNTIAHLNNHFAKFGKIVNIQISYDGDPEAAIVTFSTHAEANVAYRSTEAVLNNRFIKVFWHSQDLNASSGGSGGGIDNAVMHMPGGRKNSQYHLNNVPAVPTPAADSAKISNAAGPNAASNAAATSQSTTPTTSSANTISAAGTNETTGTTVVAATHVPPPSLRLKNNVTPRTLAPGVTNASIRKKQEEQAKAVVQLANGLRKRKQELLQSYVKQMKSALEIVERCEPNDPQRAKTLETVKVLQETIDKLHKEIAVEQEHLQAQIQNQLPPPPKKTKEQQKKELLDIELELFAQQQEGNDTTAIQKRLEELQRSMGIVPGSATLGGHGSPNAGGGKAAHFANQRINAARPRPTFPEGSTRVDRRPKTIVVTGFTSEEADFVLGHFKHFGEITKHDVDKEIPQLILSYSTRINAEQAVLRGKIFKDKRLQISWAPVVSSTPTLTAGATVAAAQLTEGKSGTASESKLNVDITKLDLLLAGNVNEKHATIGDIDALTTTDTLPELQLEDEEEEESEDRSWRR